ncbi:unnamed protein product [Acanthoscelides obtectus]|uniref:Uncharacterized protein n=1 Tax=Acanthoscelides obtectus TaxID=200917 RepID=A0A9P0P9J9_ACAOB|nr:unnamed protein product [Acanthoscelides obtectus]CAK1655780.1 hypothetical protein AOBTE_LOCUS19329 [Acanthoscelides obtectus]
MWEEMAGIFGGKEMTTEEKKNLGMSQQKKCKNVRDAFVKEYRKLSALKSGSGATKKLLHVLQSPYVSGRRCCYKYKI